MSTAPERMDDRRATLVAGGLIAAVVLILGFGSGFWSELSERTASGSPASSGRNLGTVVQGDGDVAVGVTPGTSAPAANPATTAPAASTASHVAAAPTATTAAPSHTTATTTAPVTTPTTSAPTVAPPVTVACSTGTVEPFWTHFEAAHLETSPGQQVSDALSLDQYVLTHTVLVENMLTPILEGLVGTADQEGAFWTHFKAAHLETSPGQQVAEALSLDQYVLTHTVLVEQMLDPIVGTC